jgi:hypothetical protein
LFTLDLWLCEDGEVSWLKLLPLSPKVESPNTML